MIKNRNFQQEAADLRREFNWQRDAVNANGRLNFHGKQGEIQELADAANEKIGQVRIDYYQWKKERSQEIEQSLFGLGHKENATEADKQAKITGYRAALEIAGRAKTKDELEKMLKQASTFGDDLLKKAVAYQADQLGYNELAALALNNNYDDELRELAKLRDNSPQIKFAEGNALSGVS